MEMLQDAFCGGEYMRYGHLERIHIKLHANSPVFIGSGESLTKKEYILDKRSGRIYIPDLGKLIGFLAERSILSNFEEYLLQPRNNDLYTFLEENKVSNKDYDKFVLYSLEAGEVITQEKFRGLLTFFKGSDGLPYIPGSSIKGAMRTAIAIKLLEKGNFESNLSDIEQAVDDFRSPRYYVTNATNSLESQLFCKLGMTDPKNPNRLKWNDIINDFMRGIQISDSKPMSFDALTISGKYDRKPDGFINSLPIYRECLVPGSIAEFTMTLDRPVLSKLGIDVNFIKESLISFADIQDKQFIQHFSKLREDIDPLVNQGITIVIGGGAGYVSKTITYPLFRDRQRALKIVGKMMTKQFPIHKHENDAAVHLASPHTLKTTMYKGKYYEMGRCELEFLS